MRTVASIISFFVVAAYAIPFALAQPASRPAPPRRYIAVFDFSHPDDPRIGRDIARRVRGGLIRGDTFDEVIDHLIMQSLTDELPVAIDAPDSRMIAWLTGRVGASAAVWGELTVSGPAHTLTVRYLDLQGNRFAKVFTDATQRARGLLARGVVEAVTGEASWTPPQYGDEAEPQRLGTPLNRNGSFDAAGFHPAGWERVDGVSSLVVHHPGRGRVLRLNTHLDRDAWLAWRRALRLGRGDARTPPPIAPSPRTYRNVGAMEGVMLGSDWIDAAPGRRYWLTADVRGPATEANAPKIFIKGYTDFPADALSEVALHELGLTPAAFAALPKARRDALIASDAKAHPERHRREVYRWYLACRDEESDPRAWRHCAAPFPPRGGLPANVKYLRIQIYAYWPLGEHLFDNVGLFLEPRRTTTGTGTEVASEP